MGRHSKRRGLLDAPLPVQALRGAALVGALALAASFLPTTQIVAGTASAALVTPTSTDPPVPPQPPQPITYTPDPDATVAEKDGDDPVPDEVIEQETVVVESGRAAARSAADEPTATRTPGATPTPSSSAAGRTAASSAVSTPPPSSSAAERVPQVTSTTPPTVSTSTVTPTTTSSRPRAPSACPTTGVTFGAVSWVAQAANHIVRATSFRGTLLGRGGRGGVSDHPSGHAIDFMTSDRATGDRIAAYVLGHQRELGVTYVIWRQRYNDGSGWDPMADRGGRTANHFDHVHVSFSRTQPAGLPGC